MRFHYQGIFLEVLEELGKMPLPPYIKEELQDNERYQTVYSKINGSAAAPTAGLHFTPELLRQIQEMGVKLCYVTLHVGLGTFRPVKAEDISEHEMHSEYCIIPEETARIKMCIRDSVRSLYILIDWDSEDGHDAADVHRIWGAPFYPLAALFPVTGTPRSAAAANVPWHIHPPAYWVVLYSCILQKRGAAVKTAAPLDQNKSLWVPVRISFRISLSLTIL